MWFYIRLYTPSILPEQQYTFHEKYTRLHIKYREDKIVALGSRQVNDYVAALMSEKTKTGEYKHSQKRTGKEIQRLKFSSVTAWKNNTKVHREGKKNVQYLTNVFTGFLNFNKNCSRNPPLKKSYIYILYICI